jgi:hypothetical protein
MGFDGAVVGSVIVSVAAKRNTPVSVLVRMDSFFIAKFSFNVIFYDEDSVAK